MAGMRLWRKQRKVLYPPQGVCVVAPDGREFPCDVLRDPDGDVDGCAMWHAVPREDLPPMGVGWMLKADVIPARSVLDLRITAVMPDAPWLP
jgi:hypothetical protein